MSVYRLLAVILQPDTYAVELQFEPFTLAYYRRRLVIAACCEFVEDKAALRHTVRLICTAVTFLGLFSVETVYLFGDAFINSVKDVSNRIRWVICCIHTMIQRTVYSYLESVNADFAVAHYFDLFINYCNADVFIRPVVLEELEHALKRNARIYAEITGFGQNCDGYSILAMPEDGEYISAMLKELVGDRKVDYYNAHGTGTKLNDIAEANVIRNVFGDRSVQPAINSTKAFVGHTIGASGAIEAIVCVDSINHNKVHGNMCKTVFDDLNYTAETRDIQVERAVSASFGFGGHNAALMIERYK